MQTIDGFLSNVIDEMHAYHRGSTQSGMIETMFKD